MARKPDLFEELTKEWSPRLRQAFLDSVDDITDRASISSIEAAIRRGDVEAAVRAVGISAADFIRLDREISGLFERAGSVIMRGIAAVRNAFGAVVKTVFNIRNPRAEAWARDHSANLVSEMVVDQHVAIRQHVTAGLENGVNPRTTALDLVGRRNPATGKREGGVIGLTARQEEWQRRYREEIASTDPATLKKAMERGLRDKRFDRSIEKAIRTGEPIPADTQAKMAAAYRNKSLKYRGDVIARNETSMALGAAQREGWQQAIDAGQVDEEAIKRFWVTAGDERVRHTHRLIPGMNKEGRGWNEPFQTPTGPSMNAPHDVDIQCRCRLNIRVNYFRGLT